MPSGMFIQNAQRQPMPSVNQPPSSGPATEERAKTPPMMPMYLPRSRAGTTSAMIACARIISPPPPRPWTARPAISQVMSWASPPIDRADDEDRDRGDEQALAADQVAELAVDRQRDGGGEDVGGGDPEHVVDAVELADDGRQRRAEDRLVERGQQHRDHQAGEDQQDVSLVGGAAAASAASVPAAESERGGSVMSVSRLLLERALPLVVPVLPGKDRVSRRRPLLGCRPDPLRRRSSAGFRRPRPRRPASPTGPFRARGCSAAAVSCSVIRAIRASIRSSSCGCCRTTSIRDSRKAGSSIDGPRTAMISPMMDSTRSASAYRPQMPGQGLGG